MALEVQKFISRYGCQYTGRAVNKIFHVSQNTTATAAEEDPFAKAFEAVINYVTPQEKKKRE